MNGSRRLLVPVFVLALVFVAASTGSAQSPFGIQSIQPTTNGGIAITWSTLPGKFSQVTSTDSLGEEWLGLPNGLFLAGTNVYSLSFTDYPAAEVMQRFYRIKTKTSRANLVMSLVLDRSGSMNVNGGAAMLPPAVSAFIDLFDDTTDRVSMSSFSYAASIDVPMRQPFKQDVKNAVNVMNFSGWTCAERGLTNGLAQNNTVTLPPGERVVKVIVFFTDGMANTWYHTFDCGPRNISPERQLWDPNTGAPASSGCTVPATLPSITGGTVDTFSCVAMNTEAQARAERIAWLARSQGNIIYAIGMGGPFGSGECGGVFPVLNPEFLKNIANTTNSMTYDPSQPSGDYVIAATASELQVVFQEIASKLLSQ